MLPIPCRFKSSVGRKFKLWSKLRKTPPLFNFAHHRDHNTFLYYFYLDVPPNRSFWRENTSLQLGIKTIDCIQDPHTCYESIITNHTKIERYICFQILIKYNKMLHLCLWKYLKTKQINFFFFSSRPTTTLLNRSLRLLFWSHPQIAFSSSTICSDWWSIIKHKNSKVFV